jgi:hypothetical protein
VLESEGIESHVVDPASIATSRRRRRAKQTRSMARRWSGHCSRTSAASHASVRWSGRPALRRKIDGHLPRAQGAHHRAYPAHQPGQRFVICTGHHRI